VLSKLFRVENQACIGAGLTVNAPNSYIRGVIAEGWLRSGQPLPDSHRLPEATAATVRNLSDAARCYAGPNSNQVWTLLGTRIASPQEEQLVAAAMNEMIACLPPGVQVRNDPSVIRFRLTEGLLRLGQRLPTTGASK
jgi:hypothetical protein